MVLHHRRSGGWTSSSRRRCTTARRTPRRARALYVVNSIETHELRECLLRYALLDTTPPTAAEKAGAAAAAAANGKAPHTPPLAAAAAAAAAMASGSSPPPRPPPTAPTTAPPPARAPPTPSGCAPTSSTASLACRRASTPRRPSNASSASASSSPPAAARYAPVAMPQVLLARARVERPARPPAGRAGAAVQRARAPSHPRRKAPRSRGSPRRRRPRARSRSESGVYSSRRCSASARRRCSVARACEYFSSTQTLVHAPASGERGLHLLEGGEAGVAVGLAEARARITRTRAPSRCGDHREDDRRREAPSSKSFAENARASSSPSITGMIGVSEWPMSKPSSLKPASRYLTLSHSLSTSCVDSPSILTAERSAPPCHGIVSAIDISRCRAFMR